MKKWWLLGVFFLAAGWVLVHPAAAYAEGPAADDLKQADQDTKTFDGGDGSTINTSPSDDNGEPATPAVPEAVPVPDAPKPDSN